VLHLLRRVFRRRELRDADQLLGAVRDADVRRAWDVMRTIWRQATIVYRDPVGLRQPLPLALAALLEFLRFHEGNDQLFYQGLLDQGPHVVAYALVALGLIDSPLVGELPSDLLERTDLIQWRIGGRAGVWSLGDMARSAMRDREGRAWLRNHQGMSVTEQYLGLLAFDKSRK
jgi:hypothetical protein